MIVRHLKKIVLLPGENIPGEPPEGRWGQRPATRATKEERLS